MATIILSAAGAAIGGPIGAAIGAVIGQQVDNAIFAPKPRQGPRLGDLTLQTSSYGSQIPKLFGAVRVAGTVIWGTDLIEAQTSQSNGKGRGSTTLYSYSASFAVALSGRRVGAIGRIWADGKLLRGAADDFKSETGFRFYDGSEDQALDPLIATIEGLAATLAYRGIAYAVFEAMALGPFGNRIPSLSFEVFADAGDVATGAIISEVSGVASDAGPLVGGMVISGDSAGSVLNAIGQLTPFSLVVYAGGLRARFVPPAAVAIARDDRGAGRGKKAVTLSTDRVAATALPEVLTVGYNSAERDYLIGAQRARRDSAARREMRVELPVTLDASVAKQMAEARLKCIWAERSRATVTVPWRGLKIDPGALITVPGLAGAWRVTRIVFEAMVLRLDLVLSEMVTVVTPVADPGRSQAQSDRVHGPTTLRVLDLPQMGDVPVTTPILVVAANGTSGGWRRASLLASLDGGLSWEPAGETAAPAIMGSTLSVLAIGPTAVADRVNAIDVRLLHDGMALSDADDAGLRSGSNLAAIGDEIIQFGRATPLGGRDWRLSELWRGRRGSEEAIFLRAVGSSFTMLDRPALLQLDARFAVSGVKIMAVGVGDATGVIAGSSPQIGRAVLPLSPVAPDATSTGSGFAMTWVRRSRDGWIWRDGIDVPVAEQAEQYRVTKRATGRPDLIEIVTAPLWTYANAELALDRAAGATQAFIDIRQVGTFGVSAPATFIISI